MKLTPGKYYGTIVAPPSKSYLQRAIAIATLYPEISSIAGYKSNDDTDAVIRVSQAMGAKISVSDDIITIKGIRSFNEPLHLNCGESGLAARMFGGISALFGNLVIIEGHGSLISRPMNMVEDAMKQLGKEVRSRNGSIPLEISGKIKHNEITIDGSETSQLLSGLLIALPLRSEDTIIHVKNLKSKPYIQMTIEILLKAGISIQHTDFTDFFIQGNQLPTPLIYDAEGDWSGAAFHLVAAAISGSVSVRGLNPDSAQGDKIILDVLKSAGAEVTISDEMVMVKKKELNAFEFDATMYPDLFPPLAVLASHCNGTSVIHGISRLVQKESNRAMALQTEFGKLGINIELRENRMLITGAEHTGGKVNSHRDHRIAMALAIMSLNASSAIEMEHPEAVNKSYPDFFSDFEELIY